MRDNTLLRSIFHDIEYNRQQVELEAIAKDQAAHRDTTLMGKRGLRWRYYVAQPKRGATEVRFCYATVPNAAGYYLTWREDRSAKGGVRTLIRGHKLRREAKESALKGYENFNREKEGTKWSHR